MSQTAAGTRDEPSDAWDGYDQWLASLDELLPTPEDDADFSPSAERVGAILAECGGDPFGG